MNIKEKFQLIIAIIRNRYVPNDAWHATRYAKMRRELDYAKLANDDLINQINTLNNLISLKDQERLIGIRNDIVIDNYVNLWEKSK